MVAPCHAAGSGREGLAQWVFWWWRAALSAHRFGFSRLQLTLCIPASPECPCLLGHLQGERGEDLEELGLITARLGEAGGINALLLLWV